MHRLREMPGNSYRRGRLNTIDLLELTSKDQGANVINFFGVNLYMLFGKLHHFINVTVIFMSCEKI
jgi:hypothetical protein